MEKEILDKSMKKMIFKFAILDMVTGNKLNLDEKIECLEEVIEDFKLEEKRQCR